MTVRIVGLPRDHLQHASRSAPRPARAAGGGFRVEAYLGFDALFETSSRCSTSRSTSGSARRSASASSQPRLGAGARRPAGPGRWEVTGRASFSILFFDVDIDFEVAWGEAAAALPPRSPWERSSSPHWPTGALGRRAARAATRWSRWRRDPVRRHGRGSPAGRAGRDPEGGAARDRHQACGNARAVRRHPLRHRHRDGRPAARPARPASATSTSPGASSSTWTRRRSSRPRRSSASGPGSRSPPATSRRRAIRWRSTPSSRRSTWASSRPHLQPDAVSPLILVFQAQLGAPPGRPCAATIASHRLPCSTASRSASPFS